MDRECEYCGVSMGTKHKGFCLTIMEGANPRWVAPEEPEPYDGYMWGVND